MSAETINPRKTEDLKTRLDRQRAKGSSIPFVLLAKDQPEIPGRTNIWQAGDKPRNDSAIEDKPTPGQLFLEPDTEEREGKSPVMHFKDVDPRFKKQNL